MGSYQCYHQHFMARTDTATNDGFALRRQVEEDSEEYDSEARPVEPVEELKEIEEQTEEIEEGEQPPKAPTTEGPSKPPQRVCGRCRDHWVSCREVKGDRKHNRRPYYQVRLSLYP